jgi:hypothetical protein
MMFPCLGESISLLMANIPINIKLYSDYPYSISLFLLVKTIQYFFPQSCGFPKGKINTHLQQITVYEDRMDFHALDAICTTGWWFQLL